MNVDDRELLLGRMLEPLEGRPDADALLGRLGEDEELRAEAAELVETDRLLRFARFLETEQPDLVTGVLTRQRCLDRNSPRFGAKVMSRVRRERRRRRPPVLAALAAAAAVVLAGVIWHRVQVQPSPSPSPSPSRPAPVPAAEIARPAPVVVGVVVAEVGRCLPGARLVREGRSGSLAAGMPLHRDDRIETPDGGEATIVFPDRTEIRLSAASRLVITQAPVVSSDARPVSKRLELVDGTLTASVTTQPPGCPMTIVTSHASVTVLGTSFTLDAAARSTRLEVEEGEVRIVRRSDGASTVVPAGFGAVAAEGVELAAVALRDVVLFEQNFEDGIVHGAWIGEIRDQPSREGSRFAMAGVGVPRGRHTEVNLVDRATGVFTYREGAVVTFEYWVGREVDALDVILWDRTHQASVAAPSLFDLRKEQWTHATVPMSEFRSLKDKPLEEGGLIIEIRIITDAGGGRLLVDDVCVAVPARRAE